MSAIAGLLHRDGRAADPMALRRMAQAIALWGPDGGGEWVEGSVALSRQVLRTTTNAGDGPLVRNSATRRLVLAHDARLDNRDELRRSLEVGATSDADDTDGALILAAYERWGVDCPSRLYGDFAFALWDEARGIVFCARDPIGVRPFYYYLADELFAFGTQIKAVTTLPEVPTRLDEETLGVYLALLEPDKVSTFYRDVSRLHPGASLEVSIDGSRHRTYWCLDDTRALKLGSDAEYAEAFKSVFSDAVGDRLRSDRPVGAMLSGGLDSSSIVCMARELRGAGDPLVTLSGTFPSFRSEDSLLDERRFQERVVAGGGVDAHYLAADRTTPLFDFLWTGEEPIPAASLYMDWAVLQEAQKLGVRALFSGNDGDSVVGYGRNYLAELAWKGRWKTLHEELFALSRRYNVGRRDLLKEWVLPTLVPGPVVALRSWLSRNDDEPYDNRSVIRRDFAERSGVLDRTRAARRQDRPLRRERPIHRMHIESSLLTLLLEVFARTAAPFEVEPRYPFLDRRVMEFCLSLPGDQKLSQGWDRVVMRRAMEGLLPSEIQWHAKKQDLTPNFNLRLLDSRDLLHDVIVREPDVLEPFIDIDALRATHDRYLDDPRRRTQDSFAVFWAAVFALWLRHSEISP